MLIHSQGKESIPTQVDLYQSQVKRKILIYSPAFYPLIGGLEAMVAILADEFTQQGHEVKLISQTPDHNLTRFSFEVIRQPSLLEFVRLVHWSDIYFQGNISLKGIWPLLFIRRPLVVTHQGWYSRGDESLSWRDRLKYLTTRFATNIAASYAVAEHIPAPSTVIPNSYRDDIFNESSKVARDRELVFVGRLVSDKGADLLLDALAKLKTDGLTPRLTIIGSGPEESNLRQQAQSLDIADQVAFVGVKREHELAQSLNSHKIIVAPSRWEEPFGIVALEGIGCGCVVVGSQGGGLKDAIGPGGVTFPNGDLEALTQALADLLTNPEQLLNYRQQASAHLLGHQPTEVAKAYLNVFERAIQ